MDRQDMRKLLEDVADGKVTPEAAADEIATAPIADLGYAQVDLDRQERTGASEVIYGAGKTAAQIAGIARALADAGQGRILATRVDAEKERQLAGELAGALPYEYQETARLVVFGGNHEPDGLGTILVVCAGTSDLPVAEEAAGTARFLGNDVELVADVGVAGIHRLLAHSEQIASASVIIAVAGMEGALASVVGGMASAPVIAVPTSVGYGASYGGLSALLAMLNSCAAGISVVNVDNGFGAGYQAHLINHMHERQE
jgi:NCAIR mutase (PurE)-related protein